MSNIVDIFIDLVKIDSPSGEEGLVCRYLQKRLAKLGINSEVDPAGNLFAKAEGLGQPVILSAHMDTVEPGRGIKPVIKSGLIKSDGTTILGADNKIAVACIIDALESVGPNKRKTLEIVFSVREETDGGIAEFDFSKLKGRTGILADRSSVVGAIGLASPWIENLEITVTGKSAHAGSPEKGINALTIVSRSISKLKWGKLDPKTTSNIGVIKGGDAMNTIPEKIFLQGEVRSFSKEKLDNQIKKIKNVFSKITDAEGADLKFVNQNYCHGFEYKKTDSHIVEIASIIEKLGITPKYEVAFGGSDANTFVKYGIKLVNIGDGGKDPHTLKESVSVTDLEKVGEIFTEYISRN